MGGLVHLDFFRGQCQPCAYKPVLVRAQMVVKCQVREPRTFEQWGSGDSQNSAGFAAGKPEFEFLPLTSGPA